MKRRSTMLLLGALAALWMVPAPHAPAPAPTEEELKDFERQAEELEKKQVEAAAKAAAKRKAEAAKKDAAQAKATEDKASQAPREAGSAIAPRDLDAVGVWQECETYTHEICGNWTTGPNGRWRGMWGPVRADLAIPIKGDSMTVTRRDLTSSLQATYRGKLNANKTEVTGTVRWCCDALGTRRGTWWARLTGAGANVQAPPPRLE